MKKQILLLTVIVFTTVTFRLMAQVPSYVPASGLISYYGFNSTGNDAISSSVSTANTAIPTTDRFDIANSAYQFNDTTVIKYDGTNPLGTIGNSDQTFTINFWVNTANTSGSILLGAYGWGYYVNLDNTNKIHFTYCGPWGAWTDYSSLSSISTNNWHMITIIKSDLVGTIYIDNVLDNIISVQDIRTYPSISCWFGANGQDNNSHLSGKLDDIGIWNRELTATEIDALQKSCTLAVTTNPTNQNVSVGGSAQFSTACNDVAATYQWLTNTGSGFVNCVDGGQYSGSTTATFTFSNATQTIQNQPFRCLITSGFCNVTTNEALLTVSNQLAPEILYYKFDGTGTNVPNLATTPPVGATTATIMGGVSQGSNGQCGSALVGSGVSSTTDYLNTNWNTNFGTNSWTISFWSSGFSDKTTLDYLFGDYTANNFRCFTNGVAGSDNWMLRGGGLVDVQIIGGALTGPTLNTFVYDNVTLEVKAYLNGVLVNTVAQTSLNIVGSSPFKVMGYNTNIGAPVGGLLDEFRVYNRALTDGEVLALTTTYVTGVNTITACHEYTWIDGVNYTASNNTATHTLTGGSFTGCDSIVTLNLTILPTETSSSVQNICFGSAFTYSDGTISTNIIADESHISTLVGAAANGCDKIITENLIALPLVSSEIQRTLCHGSSYMYIDGTAVSNLIADESHVSTLVAASYTGCDSLVTENLVTLPVASSEIQQSLCHGSSFVYVDGTIVSNLIADESHVSTFAGASYTGCDSLVIENLEILPVASSEIQQTLCYGSSFVYIDGTAASNLIADESHISTLIGASYNGCDSLVTENVIVMPLVNATAILSSNTLTATPSGASYQWLDCNNGFAIIPNENGQTYTVTNNGSYAVEVSTGTCSDTSICIEITTIGINETFIATNKISVYPNPANDYFTIISNVAHGKVIVMDMLGKVILSQAFTSTEQIVNTSYFENGMYVVEVRNNKNEIIGRTRVVIHQ